MTLHVDSRWWTEDFTDSRHEAITRVVRAIRQNQEYRKVEDLLHASMYSNRPLGGFGLASSARRPSLSTRLSLNVVRNMVGAVTSKIAAKNKPKCTFLPDGGDFEDRENCEKLEKFVAGVFYEAKLYPKLTQCFRDCGVFGTTFMHWFEQDDKVACERVRQVEMVVDDQEAMDGEPRNMFRRKYIDRLVLKHLWASGDTEEDVALAMAIDASKGSSDDQEYAYKTSADQVLVTEGWHLAEGKGVSGRHCIVIDGATLLDEEWEGDFPFAVLRWSEDTEGYFGVGLAEELRGIQQEINTLLMQIQRGHHLITGHWFVEGGSKVQTQHVNNDLAAIVKYTGTMPVYQAPGIISPEVYSHLWKLYEKAFEISGISQLNATGQRPAGLNSGVAQRTYQDIQTERFLEVGQNYEEFVVECARQAIRVAKKIGGKLKVRSLGKGDVTVIDWSEINLKDDPTIKVHPTSMIPSTPAGRLEWAQDMINSKVIPPEDVLDIVDFPDTEAYAKRKNAPRKTVERNIAAMLRGEYRSPEPFDPHQMALKIVNEAYHEARNDNVPEARLELLRRYMGDTADFLKPPPMTPAATAADVPPGMGGPPPPMPPPPMPGPPMEPPMGQAA